MRKETKKRTKRTIKNAREKGVKIYVKLSDGTKLPWTSKKTKLYQTLCSCTSQNWKYGIDVCVNYQPGVTNGNIFYKLSDVKESISLWLSPDLVEYCTEGKWQ